MKRLMSACCVLAIFFSSSVLVSAQPGQNGPPFVNIDKETALHNLDSYKAMHGKIVTNAIYDATGNALDGSSLTGASPDMVRVNNDKLIASPTKLLKLNYYLGVVDLCNTSTNSLAFTGDFEQGEAQKSEGDAAYGRGDYKLASKKYADAYLSLQAAWSEMSNYYTVIYRLRSAYVQILTTCSEIENQ